MIIKIHSGQAKRERDVSKEERDGRQHFLPQPRRPAATRACRHIVTTDWEVQRPPQRNAPVHQSGGHSRLQWQVHYSSSDNSQDRVTSCSEIRAAVGWFHLVAPLSGQGRTKVKSAGTQCFRLNTLGYNLTAKNQPQQ